MAENPFTRRDRERHEEEAHIHEYDLSSVALALVNVLKAVPEAKEVREFKTGLKRALHNVAERL